MIMAAAMAKFLEGLLSDEWGEMLGLKHTFVCG
jgi:hypothetical protein